MAHVIRDRDPEIYRLITIRTYEARLWMTPSNNVRKLIGGILARYQEILGIVLYAYAVLGNHLHLVARAPRSNMDEFEENVNREIARRLNWKHGRRGKFWGRRYSDLKILSEEDLLEAFLYVTTNPTKHGLVSDPRDWPGLHSYDHVLSEEDRLFTFHHYSPGEEGLGPTTHRLKLSILPQFANVSQLERRKAIGALLQRRVELLVEGRRTEGRGFLELNALMEQDPGSVPLNVSYARRPCCYTQSAALRREYRKSRALLQQAYAAASQAFRGGDRETKFPNYTFLPPLHRAPRLGAFKIVKPGSPLCRAVGVIQP